VFVHASTQDAAALPLLQLILHTACRPLPAARAHPTPPGTGKTTLLRDVARLLSDDLGLGVVVVDGSGEIAGDGDEPHPCIGATALRLHVSPRAPRFLGAPCREGGTAQARRQGGRRQ
jgi:hypothetical protein